MSQKIFSGKYSNSKFHIIPIAIFIILLGLYISLSFTSFANVHINRMMCLVLCVVVSILYLIGYRRDCLLCYESVFFSLYILCVFFSDLVLDNLDINVFVSSVYYTSFTSDIESKSILVQMLAFFAFMSAAAYNNYKNRFYTDNQSWISGNVRYYSVDYSLASNILGACVALYLSYLYISGIIASWFHYSGNISNYTNMEIIYSTTLCTSLSVIEITRLNLLGCNSFRSFARSVNKICLADIIVLSVLLLISGNRNECLLILLPAVILYSALIHKISNRQFFVGALIGIGAMIFIGIVRQYGDLGASGNVEFGLFEATRDFGLVDPNTKYLISYVDKNGPAYFNNTILNIISSVPFLGGMLSSLMGLSYTTRSTELTTEGMQHASNLDSGLGTSLVGDLYYTGSLFLVLLFMLSFGWLVSSMHNRFVVKKIYNPWLLILYSFNFANVVYYIRAEWTMPCRYVGFSCLIFLLVTTVCKKSR